MNALVVDDLSFMRSVIGDMLKDSGFRVIGEAVDGRDAVDKYRKLQPDVVILDITMPVMDGLKALEIIKKYDPSSVVVMCSSMSDQDNIIRAIQLGAADFVVKPFKKSRMISAVRKALSLDE
ncbi:response regulator [Spirochaeta isovalerica]|uniref:Two-component system chemotaxis response regulator CheY n=1 Tax=Spirochaeta isovalerica TaxID=150 RepID=A0A841R1Q5_9SPIO|nr:response regulator [Spirochaeta isovalerica]MBB6478934.1 two-component system chemotaxis response regulator CheY [Spirochaeta isovalerica]